MELPSRRLLWAIAVSAILHLVLMFRAEIPLPDWAVAHEPIEVALVAAPKPQPAPEPPKPEPKPQPKKVPKPPKPRPVAKPALPPPPPAPAQPEPAVVAQQTSVPVAAAPEPDPPKAMEPLPPIPDEPAAVPKAPKHVEIEFRGMNGSKGSGKQVFERGDDGRYTLSGEMSMPVFLFVSGTLEQHSEGLITPQGLQPTSFRQKVTGNKPQTASFDWDKGKVVMDTGKRTDTVDLPPGTQDMLSFMYQFMFVPPLDEMRLTMVTGKKLKTYVYTFEGDEQLDTQMGKVHALHISRNIRDGDEKTELWLAVDHRYLPVRIRRTEKDGASIDLVVTRLTLTD
jgi:hypothetical protein